MFLSASCSLISPNTKKSYNQLLSINVVSNVTNKVSIEYTKSLELHVILFETFVYKIDIEMCEMESKNKIKQEY